MSKHASTVGHHFMDVQYIGRTKRKYLSRVLLIMGSSSNQVIDDDSVPSLAVLNHIGPAQEIHSTSHMISRHLNIRDNWI